VQVRRLRETAVSGATDGLALGNVLADRDVDFAQVGKYSRESVVVYDLDHLAHPTADIVAGVLDDTVCSCGDLGADTRSQVHTAVQTRAFDYRMLSHAEAAGHRGLLQRVSAGNRAEHQPFLECCVAGDGNALGNRQRRRRIESDDGFELFQIVAERDQFGGARVDLRGQFRLTFEKFSVSFQRGGIAVFELRQVGVKFFDSSGERINHEQAAQKNCADCAAGRQRCPAHQLGERVMSCTVTVCDRDLIVVAHTKPLFL